MRIAILQSNYIPWKGYFDLIHDVDIFIFYDVVKYTKNDWRNRNQIYTKNGKQWITIPIEAHNVHNQINEVIISDTEWQKNHFKGLYLGYKKAPFFFQLEELMEDYLHTKTWNKLSDLNQYLIKKIASRMGITTIFKRAEDFNIEGDKIERLISLLRQNEATSYLSGPAAKSYIDGKEYLFKEHNITLKYKQYGPYDTYKQLSPPFENAVSIVDLIANIAWDQIPDYIWNNKNINN